MHGMRPFGALVSKEEALSRLLAAARPLSRTERVLLALAAGRALAEPLRAERDVPPYARATMDGYAVRSADPATLRVWGDVFAGSDGPTPLPPGGAYRIATGAPVPPGADAVVRVEDTSEKDGIVTLRAPVRPGQNVDVAGSDIAAGALVLDAGAVLTPARLGLVASLGHGEVLVRARPRVALFSTGDELLAPGAKADPWRIYDSNTTTLAALCEGAGADVARAASLPDRREELERALREAAISHDAIVVSGGASVGEKDLLAAAVRALGEVLFHGVRVKPGKPLLAGRIGGALVVGLPGNPTSALTNASLFVAPALRRMAGLPEMPPHVVEARLSADVVGEAERFLFLPVRLDAGSAIPTFKGSGALTSLAASDGWIGVPEGARLAAGSVVRVTRW